MRNHVLVTAVSMLLLAGISSAAVIDLQTNGQAEQNSNYSPTNYLASFGIDGNTGNFTHTKNTGPYPATWQVLITDGSYYITDLVLHNRDGNTNRFRDLTVEIVQFTGDVANDFTLGTGGTVSVNTFTELGKFINPGNNGVNDTGVTLVGGASPDHILVDFVAMTGAAAEGNLIRIARERDGTGTNDDATVLSLGEVYANGTPVPEPATMSLLALSGLAVLRRRRRS